jgi:hypothetical protein
MKTATAKFRLFFLITCGLLLLTYLLSTYFFTSKPLNTHKKYFITFGNERFIKSRERLAREASKIGVFDEIIVYDESLIKTMPSNVQTFVAHNKRGYGYWVWKSFAVLKTLEKMQDGDLLLYADAGCQIKKKGKKRLEEYFEILSAQNQFDVLSFKLEHMEKKYTKMDVFDKFNMHTPEYLDSMQYMATCFIIRKSPHSMKMVQDWVAASQDFHLIDDSASIAHNDPAFIEHRHDQSLWSLIRKRDGTIVLDDETELGHRKDAPILAKRIIE